jgi:ATP-dependent Clp protease ATP-binding subunit ClpA
MHSKNLEETLHRALSIAMDYHHEYATLEHLLLALTDDKDAKPILIGCNVKIDELKNNIKNFLMNDMSALINNNITEIRPTSVFERVIHRAVIHAHSVGKQEINGANILSEIFSERDSYSVCFLHEQNITCMNIINFIQEQKIII